MLEHVLTPVAAWVVNLISHWGYPAVVVCMTIESACIPLPSEIIMPFSGYLVSLGRFSLWGITLSGAFGNLIGGGITYWLGVWGGRPFFERYGRYVLISRKDLARADRWFARFGEWSILLTRNLPIIRTFISLPAGVARMNWAKFALFTFFGSLPWCFALGFIGKTLGEHWEELRVYFRKADIVIAAILVVVIGLWIYRHIKDAKELAGE
jgi:membrane protein DedA with SNARE-associated domain